MNALNKERAEGFDPVFDGKSEALILGSFPSVKSRAVNFYYGNPQNRFWKTVCGYFNEEIAETVEGKREFLLMRHIALWDVVECCEIMGSSDASISDVRLADIPKVLCAAPIRKILCNGATAYRLLKENFPAYISLAEKLPSTSPANPRFSEKTWRNALDEVFLHKSNKRD